MKVEFLNFEEAQSAVDAEWARRAFVEASNDRFDFWLEHLFEKRTLQQEAWYQAKLKSLFERERDCWSSWKNLEDRFIAEMTVKFNPPPERDNIFTVLSNLDYYTV